MFADSESFPRELLQQPFERRTGFFKEHKVAPSHLMRAYELLKDIIRQPAGTTIVKVIGLTGAAPAMNVGSTGQICTGDCFG